MLWDRNNLIYRRMQSAIHSGLLKYERDKEESQLFKRHEKPEVKPLWTSRNFIVSTIIIYVALILISFLIFATETVVKYVQPYRYLYWMFLIY